MISMMDKMEVIQLPNFTFKNVSQVNDRNSHKDDKQNCHLKKNKPFHLCVCSTDCVIATYNPGNSDLSFYGWELT
jgi:hypothetical protein